MCILLSSESLLKTVLSILEVSTLVLVFLLDIGVDVDVLHLLVLDVWIKILVHSILELVKVINILDNPIDGVLEATDEDVVGSDLGSVVLDKNLHVILSGSQIVDNITQIGINLVIMSQILIHIVGLLSQSGDFHTSWSNFSLKLLDFVIEDKLELF